MLNSMKVAISLPDDLYRDAEKAARQLGLSRSQLYAAALAEYLARRRSAGIVAALDAVYSKEPARLDPVLERMQMASLKKEQW
jgi:metal-responsive CopG/Arc/MetJ family transcriptional regulator